MNDGYYKWYQAMIMVVTEITTTAYGILIATNTKIYGVL